MIEGLAEAFTANILNEITKFQIENDSLIQDIQMLKSSNAVLLLEKRNFISQINELTELKAENESLKTETRALHSEVYKLQSEIN
ncbi:unnamed protein product [Rhizophagus irregularis]|nr:unnamed protein product [Rhizophagus irregularis]